MKNNIETKCIHEGWKPKRGESRQLPVYQSTTFISAKITLEKIIKV